MNKNILVTGAAGFIGFHLCKKLLKNNYKVVGIDNISDYYDTNLKEKRLELLSCEDHSKNNNWNFIKSDITDEKQLEKIFKSFEPKVVINLAAQAGVRYSLKNPKAYINSNIVGFNNLLECCRLFKVNNLLYASSSSVYGGNTKIPFSEIDSVNHPISMYAATKRANELMAHTYSHLFGIPSIGMRFFTVYGPWGRPDMAPMIFTKAILNNDPISIFNSGKMSRSFTYIDDVTDVIKKLIEKPAYPDVNFNTSEPNPSTSWCPHRIFNIGNPKNTQLLKFIECLEKELGKKGIKEYKGLQPGDVSDTYSDNTLINNWLGTNYETPLSIGIKKFIKWYLEFYKYKKF